MASFIVICIIGLMLMLSSKDPGVFLLGLVFLMIVLFIFNKSLFGIILIILVAIVVISSIYYLTKDKELSNNLNRIESNNKQNKNKMETNTKTNQSINYRKNIMQTFLKKDFAIRKFITHYNIVTQIIGNNTNISDIFYKFVYNCYVLYFEAKEDNRNHYIVDYTIEKQMKSKEMLQKILNKNNIRIDIPNTYNFNIFYEELLNSFDFSYSLADTYKQYIKINQSNIDLPLERNIEALTIVFMGAMDTAIEIYSCQNNSYMDKKEYKINMNEYKERKLYESTKRTHYSILAKEKYIVYFNIDNAKYRLLNNYEKLDYLIEKEREIRKLSEKTETSINLIGSYDINDVVERLICSIEKCNNIDTYKNIELVLKELDYIQEKLEEIKKVAQIEYKEKEEQKKKIEKEKLKQKKEEEKKRQEELKKKNAEIQKEKLKQKAEKEKKRQEELKKKRAEMQKEKIKQKKEEEKREQEEIEKISKEIEANQEEYEKMIKNIFDNVVIYKTFNKDIIYMSENTKNKNISKAYIKLIKRMLYEINFKISFQQIEKLEKRETKKKILSEFDKNITETLYIKALYCIEQLILNEELKYLKRNKELYNVLINLNNTLDNKEYIVNKVLDMYNNFYRDMFSQKMSKDNVKEIIGMAIDEENFIKYRNRFCKENEALIKNIPTLNENNIIRTINKVELIFFQEKNPKIEDESYTYTILSIFYEANAGQKINLLENSQKIYKKLINDLEKYKMNKEKERLLKGDFSKEIEMQKQEVEYSNVHNGYEFEEYVANLFRKLDYRIEEVTKKSGDQRCRCYCI